MTRLKRRRRLRNSLTNKQKLFVSYYMVHLNGKKAAIDAGYSRKTSGAQGSRLLSNVNIRRLIDKRIQNRTKQINLTTNKVLRDIEFTRLRALESRHFGTAAKCSELMGKHLGMFRDNILIENEIHFSPFLNCQHQDAKRSKQVFRLLDQSPFDLPVYGLLLAC
jgi:hypothetical protein